MKFLKFGAHVIEEDQMYFLAYVGGKRELARADQAEYNKIILLPWQLRQQELAKMGNEKNPNLVPVRGRELIQLIKDHKFVPFFCENFARTHILQVNDLVVYESMKQKNYDIALKTRG